MPKVTLSSAEAQALDRSWEKMRPFYDLLAMHRYEDLSPPQRKAQLALFYSNEINNGGHLQYFHNQGVGRAEELLAALGEMGATTQQAIFAEALAYARQYPVEHADSLDEYSDWAHEQEFRDWDDAFYALAPDLGDGPLPDYIIAHLDDFAEVR